MNIPSPPDAFDVIVVFNYLQRGMMPEIISGLKPGGLLIFEAMTTGQLRWKPDFNPDYLLKPGELVQFCKGLHLIKYREADIPSGQSLRSVASLVARKE